MEYRQITKEYDAALAEIIRKNLKDHNLDIPGTVYFDDNLNHLSDYYLNSSPKRYYYILTDDEGTVVGGIGLAEFEFFEDCAELQKLYLDDSVKGRGIGYELIRKIEEKAGDLGYKRMYLETHDNLQAAMYEYEKCGYKEIERPAGVVHGAMNHFYLKELT